MEAVSVVGYADRNCDALERAALRAAAKRTVAGMTHPCGLEANRLYQGDCLDYLRQMPDGCVDLAFADPPFNIGYTYDVYDDRREAEKYLDWSRQWGGEIVRVLKATGTFWLAIGDEFAAELKLIFQRELGLMCRNWVIWYYTFGVHCQKKFSR